MIYKREQIQLMFQSSFDLNKWNLFIKDFFLATEEVQIVPKPSSYINIEEGVGYEMGYLNTKDDYKIGFFCLRLNKSIDKRKVGLRQMIDKYIKIDADAGIVVFDDGNHWRLSFITDLHGEKTSPKRYTFVFGDDKNGYRTAVDRFMELQRKGISFANIKEAFSVEALTKQFYNDLFDWYCWALKPDTGVYFPNNPNTPADDRENLDTKMIRLITRLMFVWFIKQKGLVPDALFNPEEVNYWLKDFDPQSMASANYYQAILQNLFFATLNRPIKTPVYDKEGNQVGEERRGFAHLQGKADVKSLYRYQELFKINEDKILSIFECIPFINGGLFECLDKNKTSDGVENAYYEDGFSRNMTIKDGRWTKRAFVPNKLFFDPEDGIISIFNRYNFTVEENSPSEQQVALDPELLGKVFENLLGVYDPNTQKSAKKASGSYYTPREIVEYMVDNALLVYLGNTNEVKALFNDDFEYDKSKKAFYESIIEKLKTIKVLDPACGSGAFPMGMLNRIIEIMQRLQAPNNKYDLKLQIMENCIYGGDILTIAAQITKLRFFISLVCDCKKTDNSDENYGIPNLPNLETHFVTCNSLIGLQKPQEYSLFEQDIIALKTKLQKVRHEHFTAKTVYQKNKLRDRDKQLRDELAQMLSDDNIIASEDAKQMAAWNPYDQNSRSSFFDAEWMFGIKDGFNVVIGNPPYGATVPEEEKKYYRKYYDSAKTYNGVKGSVDTFCVFIERGFNELKENGVLSFIVPMSITSSDAMEQLHKKLLKNCDKVWISSYGDRPKRVFENAEQQVSIISFVRTNTPTSKLYMSGINKRISSETISELINKITFVDAKEFLRKGRIPKIGSCTEQRILRKLTESKLTLKHLYKNNGAPIYYRKAGGRYYKVITTSPTHSSAEGAIYVDPKYVNALAAVLSSTLYYWFWLIHSDWHNMRTSELEMFPISDKLLTKEALVKLSQMYEAYYQDLLKKSKVMKSGLRCFYARQSKELIDNIDRYLGQLYNIDNEDVEFLINFDNKYRCSDDE